MTNLSCSNCSSLICANCEGKGHVADPFMIILTSLVGGVGILLYFMQRNQKYEPGKNVLGVTRETCCQCGGKGKIR